MQVYAGLERKVLILKWRRDYLFTDVGYVRVDIPLSVTVRKPAEVGHRLDDHLVFGENQSVQMNRDKEYVVHGVTHSPDSGAESYPATGEIN